MFAAAAYAWSLPVIYDRVGSIRITAGQRYGGDKVSALTAPDQDGRAPYRLGNEACWALGQLGDPRALPVLQKLDTPGRGRTNPGTGTGISSSTPLINP